MIRTKLFCIPLILDSKLILRDNCLQSLKQNTIPLRLHLDHVSAIFSILCISQVHPDTQPVKNDSNKKFFPKQNSFQTINVDVQGFRKNHAIKSFHIKYFFKIFRGWGFEPMTAETLICWRQVLNLNPSSSYWIWMINW